MIVTASRPARWFRRSTLAFPLALAGCGGQEAPPAVTAEVAAPTQVTPARPVATLPSSPFETTQAVGVPASADGGAPEPGGAASAAPELAATRDRATIDAAAAQVQHNVEQGTSDLKAGVNQAVGEVQAQAKQTASDAADGVKGFAAELRDEAKQALTDSVNQVKANAQGQVRSAVDNAKQAARRKAKAAGDAVSKKAEGVTDEALNSLLGPTSTPKN